MKRSGWVLLVAFAACRFDNSVPSGVYLTCTTDADCPRNYKCSASAMCWSTQSDGVAPSLLSFNLTPTAARAGVHLSLRLTASELLQAAPLVSFDDGGTWSPTATATPPSYGFDYLTLGTEPEGVHSLSASLIDTTGTPSTAPQFASVTFDFTPPSLVSSTVTYGAGLAGLGATGSATLVVALSEPTAGLPVLSDDRALLAFTSLGVVGDVYTYAVTAAGQQPFVGPVTVKLSASDAVGNAAMLTLPDPVLLNTVPPSAPDTATPGQVVFRRAPWGDVSQGPSFDLTGASGSVPGQGTVVVTVPSLSYVEIAHTQSTLDGGFGPLVLPAIDVTQLAISFIDSSGNESPRAPVRDVKWTASPASAPSGDVPSPHLLTTQTATADSFTQSRALPPVEPNVAGRVDGTSLVTRSGAVWREHTAQSPPMTAQLVSAPGLSGLYAFDGVDPYVVANYYGTQILWRHIPLSDPELDGNPPDAGAVAYDEARRTVVMISGGHTWLFDGSSWKKGTAALPPLPAVLAWDSDRDRLLWLTTTGLWSFDGAAWNAEASPGLHALTAAYDRERSTLIAIDSTGLPNALPSDGGAWAALPPILVDGGVPGAVRLVWDDLASEMIARSYDPKAAPVAGSPSLGCPTYTLTYNHAWDGTQWSALNTPPTTDLTPPCGDVAFDPRQRNLVQGVFVPSAGMQVNVRNTAGNWVQPTSIPIFPPVPSAAGLLFQSSPGLMARWMGHNAGSFPLPATQADYFNGATWQPAGGVPTTLPGAWAGSVVNLGPYLNVFGGGHANTGPPCQSGGGMCGCATACNGEGCSCGNPLWTDDEEHVLYFLQGGLAVPHATYVPGGNFRITFDPVRNQLIAVNGGVLQSIDPVPDGGYVNMNNGTSPLAAPQYFTFDTRGYVLGVFSDGSTRTLASAGIDWVDQSQPAPQPMFDVNTDPVSGHTIAVTTDGRVFEWRDAEGWATVQVSDPYATQSPPPRSEAVLSPSAALKATYVYGGTSPTATTLSDIWELRFANLQPSTALHVDLTAAGFPPGTQFSALTIDAVAGDSCADGGISGVALEIWDEQRWTSLISSDAGFSAPAPLTGQVLGAQAQKLIGGKSDFSARVRGLAPSADTPSQLALDAIDVTVTARLPPGP